MKGKFVVMGLVVVMGAALAAFASTAGAAEPAAGLTNVSLLAAIADEPLPVPAGDAELDPVPVNPENEKYIAKEQRKTAKDLKKAEKSLKKAGQDASEWSWSTAWRVASCAFAIAGSLWMSWKLFNAVRATGGATAFARAVVNRDWSKIWMVWRELWSIYRIRSACFG